MRWEWREKRPREWCCTVKDDSLSRCTILYPCLLRNCPMKGVYHRMNVQPFILSHLWTHRSFLLLFFLWSGELQKMLGLSQQTHKGLILDHTGLVFLETGRLLSTACCYSWNQQRLRTLSYISPFQSDRKGRDVSYDAPVVKAHQFPQHFNINAVG